MNMKTNKLFFWIGLLLFVVASCGKEKGAMVEVDIDVDVGGERGIYHWKTVYNPTQYELDFLKEHRVKNLYVKMFDVVPDVDNRIVPVATTKFEQVPPEEMNVIPTVFITNEALYAMGGDDSTYARKIVDRVMAMVSYNELKNVKEVQLDCDWTAMTQDDFFDLCRSVKYCMGDSMQVSATIRLHQLSMLVPPVDKGVLMLYNTGAIKNVETRNSILDYADVKPYLQDTLRYELPLTMAFPTYRWRVLFNEQGRFGGILHEGTFYVATSGETIREECGEMKDILKTKGLVSKQLVSPCQGGILYLFDSVQLSNYTSHEIEQIYR